VIHAEGELQASEKLLQAAEILAQRSEAMQLRYLQTLTQIAGDKASTIVFPVPMDVLGPQHAVRAGCGPSVFTGIIRPLTPISWRAAARARPSHREDDGRGLVAGDLRKGLQVAELHRFAALGQYLGRLQELLGRLQLAFGVDHLGAALALGLGLARDRAIMVSLMSTCLISTFDTLMPQASVACRALPGYRC